MYAYQPMYTCIDLLIQKMHGIWNNGTHVRRYEKKIGVGLKNYKVVILLEWLSEAQTLMIFHLCIPISFHNFLFQEYNGNCNSDAMWKVDLTCMKISFITFQMRCFTDFKSGGALCHILAATFKFKTDQGW